MSYTGPSKEAFLAQIDADLANESEDKTVLEERHQAVDAADSDEAASEAYFGHLENK